MVVLPLPAYPLSINTCNGLSKKASSFVRAVSCPEVKFRCLKKLNMLIILMLINLIYTHMI
jgi:hypothetical protein